MCPHVLCCLFWLYKATARAGIQSVVYGRLTLVCYLPQSLLLQVRQDCSEQTRLSKVSFRFPALQAARGWLEEPALGRPVFVATQIVKICYHMLHLVRVGLCSTDAKYFWVEMCHGIACPVPVAGLQHAAHTKSACLCTTGENQYRGCILLAQVHTAEHLCPPCQAQCQLVLVA